MMKLLAFSGSSRKDSINSKLVQAVADLSQSHQPGKVEMTFVNLMDFDAPNIDGANASRPEMPHQVIKFRDLLRIQDGFIIGSDEYTGAYSSVLRNLISWLVLEDGLGGTAFNNKPVAICGASSRGVGSVRGHPALQQLFLTLGANVISQNIRLGTAGSIFQSNGKLTDNVQTQLLDNTIAKLLFPAE
ncbi:MULTISPECIES: NADPH-dependent FMN reductase [Roseobacteraceae]|jgi:NAD(P)H-dependent FMN reductase|uniref:Putative flavoprotein n=1 Tax=Celeribacter baekdonensis B30 TaxID=1208323 RepID=K2IY48_9RHOB|nr:MULTISPECIES: NADPH-dependent FMN reductase [Roseobacteraceae]EKE67547.1 putative flavoprotein [Celeribacter baekdonensis B30]TMV89831.1 NAD(P)H-dependent oxidoreductase [Thioclava sp. BHET1]